MVKKPITKHNLTVTATISREKVEFVQYLHRGGTTKEYFELHFLALVNTIRRKHPAKKIVILMDNLSSHKTILIRDVVRKHKMLSLLLLSPNSPEFSPIENMFGSIKS